MKNSEVQNHELWIERRDKYLSDHGPKCTSCGTESNPHVHHKCYQNGRAYWDYSDDDLEVLCVVCHAIFHSKVPITKLYTLGYDISPSYCTKKLSKPVEKLRRLVIKKNYTPEMVFNNYASEFKTIHASQVIEFEFILGLYMTQIIDFLHERGVVIEYGKMKTPKKPKKTTSPAEDKRN